MAKSQEQWRRERTLYPFLVFAAGVAFLWWAHGTTFDLDAVRAQVATQIEKGMLGRSNEKFQ